MVGMTGYLLTDVCSLQSNIFDEYRIEGKDERNEIYLELNMEQLSRALKSTLNAQMVKIKLTKKQGACLSVEIVQVCDLVLFLSAWGYF